MPLQLTTKVINMSLPSTQPRCIVEIYARNNRLVFHTVVWTSSSKQARKIAIQRFEEEIQQAIADLKTDVTL